MLSTDGPPDITTDLIYASSSRVNLSIFLVVSTNVLFLLGAGLFSKGVAALQRHFFNTAVGGEVGELASGPGSYNTVGNVWQLDFGSFFPCFTLASWLISPASDQVIQVIRMKDRDGQSSTLSSVGPILPVVSFRPSLKSLAS